MPLLLNQPGIPPRIQILSRLLMVMLQIQIQIQIQNRIQVLSMMICQ